MKQFINTMAAKVTAATSTPKAPAKNVAEILNQFNQTVKDLAEFSDRESLTVKNNEDQIRILTRTNDNKRIELARAASVKSKILELIK